MLSIMAHEFHGLLYILTACMMILIVKPIAMVTVKQRGLLFIAIFVFLSVCYMLMETTEPYVFALYLIPILTALGAIVEGWLAGVVAWAAFLVCGYWIVGTEPVATALATSVLLLLGILFHHRWLRTCELRQLMYMALLLISIYEAVYIGIYYERGHEVELGSLAVILAGTFVSTVLVFFAYYQVRNHERMQEELFNAEKYHMIGQLAASISHEIRNPLTTTRGFLQMMGKPNINNEALERYRAHAIDGIEHANSIITDYLNYAKPTIEDARPIDVKAEINALIPWISPLSVMSSIEIKIIHEQEANCYIMGEPKKFQQCLLNLLKNAIEAMPGGGVLTITTRVDQSNVYIQIADTGIGMNKLQLKRIGMPFFTTKEKGTGLGLMVVVSLVKVMGGQIVFSSKTGKGTICEIRYVLYG
ncbi:HAMP domain-containing sensor histidine kinase [Paenibacillus sp. OV219]|uniref:sensor histidine kinase n=1 Tax=Paenibacillus sp. OV219 TaxID=1884377 RepID=UPI0008C3037A|nr:HAMP domain-containing sensor histidine kinase [Paenibacillus sp. OV219]SEO21324.1 two-component system, sporulation sensor kinase B [Paenibacillus sp. OV219]